jgi:hypothetical protein
MSYPDPRVNPGGFPVATDIFPNAGVGVETPGERRRELPPFGPAFVPFVDGRITDLERTVQKLLDKWAYRSVTVVSVSSMTADSSGNIDVPITPNAILYESPAGFTFALHRLVLTVGGYTFAVPFTAAGSYWELRVGGATIYGGSSVSGAGSLPVVAQWGTRDAPRVRGGEILSLYVVGSGSFASKSVSALIQGTLDRTEEG